ncbi:MAG: zf-TFIIB domain-containing protein [Nitrospirae bacterium]|nr:zf-TFIIB domain-containing protein [Nitrospirota bacterium]
MDEKTYENIPLMKCPDCKGVWFEGDALKQLLQIALRPQTNLFFNI